MVVADCATTCDPNCVAQQETIRTRVLLLLLLLLLLFPCVLFLRLRLALRSVVATALEDDARQERADYPCDLPRHAGGGGVDGGRGHALAGGRSSTH